MADAPADAALIAELEALLVASRVNRTVLRDLLTVVTDRLAVVDGGTTPD